MVAMMMLGSLMAGLVPLLSWVHTQRRAADARQIAVHETANVMERFAARDWNDMTQAAADAVKLTPEAAALLQEPRLKVIVEAVPKPSIAKRITVELRWLNRQGDDVSPARLTSFVYRMSEAP